MDRYTGNHSTPLSKINESGKTQVKYTFLQEREATSRGEEPGKLFEGSSPF